MSQTPLLRRLVAMTALSCGALACSPTEVAEFVIRGLTGDAEVAGQVIALLNGQDLENTFFNVEASGGKVYLTTNTQRLNGRTLVVNVPLKAGTYTLEPGNGTAGEGSPTSVCVSGTVANVCGTGRVTVLRATTRQEGEQRLLDVVVEFTSVTMPEGSLTGGISACVDRHDTASCGPGIGGGTAGGGTAGGGGSSGGGGNSCTNGFVVDSLLSIYDRNNVRSANRVTVAGSGRRITVSGASVPSTGISVTSTELVSSTHPRYGVQLIIPNSLLTANRTLNFIAGQAVGVFVAQLNSSDGTIIPDSWRTDRDFGRNRDMGDLTITAVSPQIRGTFNFVATGDGYPSITPYYARINSGTFCVTP
jgi:hypothetical protein